MSKIVDVPKSCGIIAEYHPFHNGHRYHLQKAKERSQAEVMVVVMSGNFMQRGEPALIDKKVRTQLALSYGADLVIELPWYGAVQSADLFAKQAIQILGDLGVDTLCFGSEAENGFDYQAFAQQEIEKASEMERYYQIISKAHPNYSYPKKMGEVYAKVFGGAIEDYAKPNHVLGLSYARENLKLLHPMEIVTVERQGAMHVDHTMQKLASGTAIRQATLREEWSLIQEAVPSKTYEALKNSPLHTWEQYYPLLQLQVLTHSEEELAQIYQVTEGLEYRLKKVAMQSKSFEDWCKLLQSSRYTRAKIQRLSTYLLMQTTHQEMEEALAHPYLKILGMNEKGRSFFKLASPTFPVVSNIRQQSQRALKMEQRYDSVYYLPYETQDLFFKQYHPIIHQ